MRRCRVKLPGGAMAGIDIGDKARPVDVVWLHATGFNAATYAPMLQPLEDRLRINAVDLRGHGLTDLPADVQSFRSWSLHRDDIIAYLECIGSEHAPVLGGHSLGGTVALLVAAKRPDLVSGIVMADPVVAPPAYYALMHLVPFTWAPKPGVARRVENRRSAFQTKEAIAEALRGHGAFKTWPDEFLLAYIDAGFEPVGPEGSDENEWRLRCSPAWEAANFRAQRNRPWQALSQVATSGIPVTFLWAETEAVTRSREIKAIARRYPMFETRSVPGSTHFLPMEKPGVVRNALYSASARTSGRSTGGMPSPPSTR